MPPGWFRRGSAEPAGPNGPAAPSPEPDAVPRNAVSPESQCLGVAVTGGLQAQRMTEAGKADCLTGGGRWIG